jgi:polar amino acid transport system substrate-binding protein
MLQHLVIYGFTLLMPLLSQAIVFTPENIPAQAAQKPKAPLRLPTTPAGSGAQNHLPMPPLPPATASSPVPQHLPVATPPQAEASPAPQTDTTTLRLVADLWCPYNCTPTSAHPGYMIEILEAIFKEHNVKIDYQVTAWSVSLAQVAKGEKDAVIGVRKEEAPTLVYPTAPLGIYTLKAFARTNDHLTYTDITSLKDKVVGIVQDYSYGSEVDHYVATATNSGTKQLFVVSGEEPVSILTANLLANKLDIFFEDAAVTNYYLKIKDLDAKVSSVGTIKAQDTQERLFTPRLFLGIAPNHPMAKTYADWVDDGIKKLRSSGKLAEILAYYHTDDWEVHAPSHPASNHPSMPPAPTSSSTSKS